DSENAAVVYADVTKEIGKLDSVPSRDALRRGLDARESVNWKDPALAALVKKHQDSLGRLRKAALSGRCSFNHQHGPLDSISDFERITLPGTGMALLAIDARVKAAEGNLPQAFEDISALLGIDRDIAQISYFMSLEFWAWRALEDVLRLAPGGK